MIPPVEEHPSSEQLRAFASGESGEELSAVVGDHLTHCSICCAVLAELPEDDFVDKLRHAGRRRDQAKQRLGFDETGGQHSTPPHLPGFEILGELGRGGMGVVYRARQLGLNRQVALKVLLAGAHAGPHDQARFRQEAETIASLLHPGIVQIYETGVHEGLPYFAMELMTGGNLAELLQAETFTPKQAAELVKNLAEAVQAAHDRGIIHRDLKPGNILLRKVDSRQQTVDSKRQKQTFSQGPANEVAPGADHSSPSPVYCLLPTVYSPKIADFGLAKWLDSDSKLTRTGLAAGTPAYMAPEQASGRAQELGPGVDIYALGAILYELLAGRPPFQGTTPLETAQRARETEPTPLDKVRKGVPRDLATICNKCLEKTPARRYASAADLAADLRCYLLGQPIQARRVGETERAWLWARRNPIVAILFAAVFVSLLVGTIVSTYFGLEAGRRASEAEAAAGREAGLREGEAIMRRAADRRLYAARISMALQAWTNSDVGGAEALIEACRPAEGQPDFRGWEWHYVYGLCHKERLRLEGHDGPVFSLAYSPNGKWLASAGGGNLYFWTSGGIHPGKVFIRDAASGKLLHQIDGFKHLVTSLSFSRDSRLLAVGGHQGGVVLVDPASGSEVAHLDTEGEFITTLAFDSSGRLLLSASGKIHQAGGERAIRLWDVASGKTLHRQVIGNDLLSADLAPDGRSIVYSMGREICCMDAADGKVRWRTSDNPSAVNKVAFSRDGRLLATAADDGRIKLRYAATGLLEKNVGKHDGALHDAAFSADGNLLATAGDTPEIRLWNVASGDLERLIRGPTNMVRSLALSPNASLIANGDDGGVVKVWEANVDQRGVLRKLGVYAGRQEMRFSADGRQLFEVWGNRWQMDAIDARTGLVAAHQMYLPTEKSFDVNACTSPDGKWLAGVRISKDVLSLWNLETRESRLLPSSYGSVSALRFHADSSWFAVSYRSMLEPPQKGTKGGTYRYHVVVWNAAHGKVAETFSTDKITYTVGPRLENGASLAISPDGRLIAHAGYRDSVYIWDRQTGELVKKIDVGNAWCRALTFSGDGRLFAYHLVERQAVVLNVADWSARCQMKLEDWECSLALSPDGRRLASTNMFGTIKLWETDTGEPVFELRGMAPLFGSAGIRAQVAFDHTGMRLASFNNDDTTNIYDATPRPPITVPP